MECMREETMIIAGDMEPLPRRDDGACVECPPPGPRVMTVGVC